MFALQFRSHFSASHLLQFHLNSICFSTFPQIHTETSTPIKYLKNPILCNYLTDALNFTQERAVKVSNRFRCIASLQQPESVVNFLKSFGFSLLHIQSAVSVCPQILLCDPEKILGPKLRYLQELGFSGSTLGKFIAKNSGILTRSLDNTLKPCIETLKKSIGNDMNNKYVIRVLFRCNWVVDRIANAKIVSNVSYLKSCGIDDDQLSKLFKWQPRLFATTEPELRGIIKRISEMGFPMDSRMLIYAIYTVGTMTSENLERKLGLIMRFGFSRDECLEMFRRQPSLLRTSEVKLRFALEFLLDTVKLKKSAVVCSPTCLMHNLEDRLVARYRVVKILMDKGLLKKEPPFLYVLHLPEEKFLKKYISRFANNVEELLYSYKGHILESSAEEV